MTQKIYTSEEIFNIKEINEIIMSDKKDIDMANDKILLRKWRNRKRELEEYLYEANLYVEHIAKRIKKNCEHTDVTEHIQDGYERSQYSYTCNQCNSDVTIWDDFSHKHITKTKDYR